jgi:hypothetical protein
MRLSKRKKPAPPSGTVEDLGEIFNPSGSSVTGLTVGGIPLASSLCDPEGLSGCFQSDFDGGRVRRADELFR